MMISSASKFSVRSVSFPSSSLNAIGFPNDKTHGQGLVRPAQQRGFELTPGSFDIFQFRRDSVPNMTFATNQENGHLVPQ